MLNEAIHLTFVFPMYALKTICVKWIAPVQFSVTHNTAEDGTFADTFALINVLSVSNCYHASHPYLISIISFVVYSM